MFEDKFLAKPKIYLHDSQFLIRDSVLILLELKQMLNLKEKRIVSKIIYSKITLGILIVLLLIVARGVWRVYGEAKMTEKNEYTAQQELKELEERKKRIGMEIDKLNSVSGIEKEIRNKFSVVKEGEEMVMILDEKNTNYKEDLKKDTFWSKILGWIR